MTTQGQQKMARTPFVDPCRSIAAGTRNEGFIFGKYRLLNPPLMPGQLKHFQP